jgi:hypothetical protein
MRFDTGLDLEFVGGSPGALKKDETFSLSDIGWRAAERRTIEAAREIRFASIYPRIDLRYHLSQDRLEYDLLLAPGARLDRVRLRFNRQASLLPDGSIRLEDPRQSILQRRAIAWYASSDRAASLRDLQTIDVRYVHCGRDICLKAEYDHSRPIVIDPVVDFGTYFGGTSADNLFASTSDVDGNLYLVGTTYSVDFPFTEPDLPQNTPPRPNSALSFIMKFNPEGKLIYATRFSMGTLPLLLAVDRSGSLYVVAQSAITTGDRNIPEPAWVQRFSPFILLRFNASGKDLLYRTYLPSLPSSMLPDLQGNLYLIGFFSSYATASPGAFKLDGNSSDRMLVRLSSTGTELITATYLESPADDISAMAMDSHGNLVVAGPSTSTLTRGASGVQPDNAGIPVFRSLDGADSWSPEPVASPPRLIAPDQGDPGRLWGLDNKAFFCSTDFGRSWRQLSDLSAFKHFYSPSDIVSTPGAPDLLFLTGYVTLKSTDGGATWTRITSDGLDVSSFSGLAVDPNNAQKLVAFADRVMNSLDGGATWMPNIQANTFQLAGFQGLISDPSNRGRMLFNDVVNGVLALNLSDLTISRVYNSRPIIWMGAEPAVPGRLLMVTSEGNAKILASDDGGITVTQIGTMPPRTLTLLVDPIQPNLFYSLGSPIQRTRDGGITWEVVKGVPLSSFGLPRIFVNPLDPDELFYAKGTGVDAIISSFSADLSTLRFSTYFGGNGDEVPGAIAVGPDDSITVVGTTTSTDLAGVYGAPGDGLSGVSDLFIARLNQDASAVSAFRLLGGNSTESLRSAALDANGNLLLGGLTSSDDYPVTPDNPFPFQTTFSGGSFVTALDSDFSILFSALLGGNSGDYFQGPNLLPDGRIWLAGTVSSSGLPVTENALSPVRLGLTDGYIMLLDWNH